MHKVRVAIKVGRVFAVGGDEVDKPNKMCWSEVPQVFPMASVVKKTKFSACPTFFPSLGPFIF